MKVAVVHGAQHKGSTYNMVHILLKKLGPAQVQEFFLPRDMPHFCQGCNQCFAVSEQNCPHYQWIHPIAQALTEADVIILDSPVYVLRATGQMKAFLDHMAYQFMPHRPNKTMFSKTGVVVTNAAGAGVKSTGKDMAVSLRFWGVGHIHSYGKAVFTAGWDTVSPKKKARIEKDMVRLAKKIQRSCRKSSPSPMPRILFYLMRFMQNHILDSPADKAYWEKEGWLKRHKPW